MSVAQILEFLDIRGGNGCDEENTAGCYFLGGNKWHLGTSNSIANKFAKGDKHDTNKNDLHIYIYISVCMVAALNIDIAT